MQEITLQELDPRLRKQVDQAAKAIDAGNPGNAVPICADLVRRFPGCFEIRRLLRRAQTQAAGGLKKGNPLLQKLTHVPFLLGPANQARKEPAKALESAEGMLAKNPWNPAAHRLLGEAAEVLGMWNTACLGWEVLRGMDPADLEAGKRWARALIQIGRAEEAVKVCDEILQRAPGDTEVIELSKQASVNHSITRGGWETGGDFRGKLKDSGTTAALEQASRLTTDDSGLESLLQRAREAVAREPDNLNHYKELAAYGRKLKRWEEALEWLEKGRATRAGQADASLERLAAQYRTEALEEQVAAARKAAAAQPGDAGAASALAAAEAELRRFRRQQAEQLVERFPSESQYRFELAQILLADGEVDGAIGNFQQAQRNPRVRLAVLLGLGRAYRAKGILDLAADSLRTARAEAPALDETGKSVLYELAEILQQQGKADEALGCYKQIYASDIHFRDVARRVESFYSAPGGGR